MMKSLSGLSLFSGRTRNGCSLLAAVMVAGVCGRSALALTYDSSAANPAAPVDGPGNWDTVTPNWSDGSNDILWPNTGSDAAVFGNGGTGGTVTVSSGITAGSITFNSLAANSSYNLTGGPITLGLANTVITTNNTSSTSLTTIPDALISAVLQGTNGLTITGPGTLTINAANTYTGATTISGGVILGIRGNAALNNAFGANLNSITLSGATITNNEGSGGSAAISLPYLITVGSGTNTLNLVKGGTIGSTGTLGGTTPFGSVTGSGTLTVNGSSGQTNNIRATFSSFTGTLNLNGGGTIRGFINGGAFVGGTGVALDIDGATTFAPQTNSGGNSFTFGSLSGSTSTAVLGGGSAGTASYSIGALNTSTTFAGAIGVSSANLNLTKVGTGNLTVSTPTGNSYTGTTTVSAGGLFLDNAAGTGTGAGAVTVANSAILGGNGSAGGAVTVSAGASYATGGHIAPGSAGSSAGSLTGTLSLTAGLTLNDFSNLDYTLNGADTTTGNDLISTTNLTASANGLVQVNFAFTNGTPNDGATYDLINYSGTLTGSPTTWTATGLASGITATFTAPGNGQVDVTFHGGAPVPEPASLGALALGGAALLVRRRRR